MSASSPDVTRHRIDVVKRNGGIRGRVAKLVTAEASVRKTAIVGFVATLAIFGTSCTRGFPFPKITAEPWFLTYFTSNPFIRYAFLAIFIASVIALCWAWLQLFRHAKNGTLKVSNVWWIWVLWALPLALTAPLFSGDVFVYYVDGEAHLRGYSIYEAGVSAMGPDDLVHMVHPIWQDTKTMYGPVFMRLATGVAWLANGNVVLGVAIFKAMAILSVALIGVAAQRMAPFFGCKATEAMVLAMVNPLVLLHFVSGAHNDAMMVGLLAIGLALGVTYRNWLLRILGLVLIGLAASIKLPAFAGLIMLGWIWAGERQRVTWRARFVGAALTGILGLVIIELLTLATGLGWGWLHALDVPGLAHPVFAPANALAYALGGVFGVEKGVNEVTRFVANIVAVGLCVYFILRLGKNATAQQIVRGLGWALLAVGWLGPSVYAWYLIWGIAIVAIAGPGRMEKMLIGLSVVACFTIYPSSGGVLDTGPRWLSVVFSYLVVLALTIAALRVLAIHGITARSMGRRVTGWFRAIGNLIRRLFGRKRPSRNFVTTS